MDPDVGRRKCLAALGSAILWPLTARAQSAERLRRVGVLIYGRGDNRGSRAQAALAKFGYAHDAGHPRAVSVDRTKWTAKINRSMQLRGVAQPG